MYSVRMEKIRPVWLRDPTSVGSIQGEPRLFLVLRMGHKEIHQNSETRLYGNGTKANKTPYTKTSITNDQQIIIFFNFSSNL